MPALDLHQSLYRMALVVSVLGIAPIAMQAQPTNLEAFQQIALNCLAEAPAATSAFVLEPPGQLPYLRQALVDHWQRQDYTVYTAADSARRALPTFSYRIEQVAVRYDRAGRRHLDRALTLGLAYTYTAADGRLLADARCADTFTDRIARADREQVETTAYPETQGEVPQGWLRRYLEPAVVIGSAALGTYLFFTLRSTRQSDG
ncbi:MAG: hypothetical protein AAF730_18070 [Bacteroidota bacterium]